MNLTKNKSIILVNENIENMVKLIRSLDEETIRFNPAPQAWSIIQIASHVSEAVTYWINFAEKTIQSPNLKLNRTYFSKSRLNAVSEELINHLTIEDAISHLENIPILTEKFLNNIADNQFKKDAIQFILKVEIIQHIEGHIHQIKRNLTTKQKQQARLKYHFLQ